MSTPSSPTSSRSQYAGGPNSPIASAKRPKASKPDLKSPGKSSSSAPMPIDTNTSRRLQATSLFSPVLKEDDEEAEKQKEEKEKEKELQEKDEAEGEEDAFNPYLFIAGLPPHYLVAAKGKICLPAQNKSRYTLVLDLDETLVHCSVEPIGQPDLTFPVTFNGVFYQVYVRKRPYLDYFLETVAKNFEVVIFTASQKVYADVLLDLLDPEKKLLSHRLFRDSCLLVQGNYLKDLSVLGRDMKKTMLVDNSPHAYGYDLNNGIPIESWFDDKTDTELLKLINFLKITEVDDVRPIIKNHFKSYDLVQKAASGCTPSHITPPF